MGAAALRDEREDRAWRHTTSGPTPPTTCWRWAGWGSTSTRSSTASRSTRCAPSRSSSGAARPTSRSPRRGTAARSALISATADDAFGRFVHRELLQLGVDDAYVATIAGGPPTPGHLLRGDAARPLPDLVLPLPDRARPHDQRGFASAAGDSRRSRLLVDPHRPLAGAEPGRPPRGLGGAWPAGADGARPRLPAGLLGRPARGARAGRAWPARGRRSPSARSRSASSRRARATRMPRPASLLAAGVDLAVVKQGPRGVLGLTADRAGAGRAPSP